MRALTLTTVALGLFGLFGCEEPGGQVCTTEARYSTTITVEDAGGTPVTDAEVTYSVDGSAFTDCESFGDGSYACGIEEDGAFRIQVEHEGSTETIDLDIESDECHVIQQTATVTL